MEALLRVVDDADWSRDCIVHALRNFKNDRLPKSTTSVSASMSRHVTPHSDDPRGLALILRPGLEARSMGSTGYSSAKSSTRSAAWPSVIHTCSSATNDSSAVLSSRRHVDSCSLNVCEQMSRDHANCSFNQGLFRGDELFDWHTKSVRNPRNGHKPRFTVSTDITALCCPRNSNNLGEFQLRNFLVGQ